MWCIAALLAITTGQCFSLKVVHAEGVAPIPCLNSAQMTVTSLSFSPGTFPADTCKVRVRGEVQNTGSEAVTYSAVVFKGLDADNEQAVSSAPVSVGSHKLEPGALGSFSFPVRIDLDWEDGDYTFLVVVMDEEATPLACGSLGVQVSAEENGQCSGAGFLAVAALLCF